MEYALITAVLSMSVFAAFLSVCAQTNNSFAGTENNVSSWGLAPP